MLKLPILSIVKAEQNEHGLRHDDFARYRRHCMRKVHKLRKALNFHHGKGKKIDPKPLEQLELVWEDSGEPKEKAEMFCLMVLMEAERAWAYAMESKALVESQPSKIQHVKRKMKRASKHANTLLKLIKPEQEHQTKSRTVLQAQAYAAFMAGSMCFESQSAWQDALSKLYAAKNLYEKLALASESAEEKALCEARIDELEPNIRYCAYMLDSGSSLNEVVEKYISLDKASAVSTEKVEKAKPQTKNLCLEWCGAQVEVANKKLGVLIKEIQKITDERDASDGNYYDRLFNAYGNALQLAQDDLKADQEASSKVTSSKTEKTTTELTTVFAFLKAGKLKASIERAWATAIAINALVYQPADHAPIFKGKSKQVQVSSSKKAKDSELARLFHDVHQNVEELRNLAVLKNDPAFLHEVDLFSFFLRAGKCYFMSRHHWQQGNGEEAAELLERALRYVGQADRLFSTRKTREIQEFYEWFDIPNCLKPFVTFLETRRVVLDAEIILKAAEKTQGKVSLSVKNLDLVNSSIISGETQKEFIRVPLPFKLIPNKPMLFDLAHGEVMDTIPYDEIEAKYTEMITLEANGGEQGLIGNIGKNLFGWWGGQAK